MSYGHGGGYGSANGSGNGYGGYGGGMPMGMGMGMNMGYPSGFGGMGGYGGGGHQGGGGRGRGRRDDRRGRGRGGYGGREERGPSPDRGAVRYKKMIVKFGDDEDFSPSDDSSRLASVLKRNWREASPGVLEGFRIGITQEPYKHPLYVCLLLQLSRRRPAEADAEEEAKVGEKRKAVDGDDEPGREVLQDLGAAFRGWVEAREWQNMRLALHFFALLVVAGLVSPQSMLGVLKALLAVLSELGGGGDRAERVIRAASESLMRCGKVLDEVDSQGLAEATDQLESAILERRGGKALFDPLSPILAQGEEAEPYQDTFGDLLAALHALRSNGYALPACLPRPWEDIPLSHDLEQAEPVHLEPVTMPPELFDLGEGSENGEGHIGPLRLFAEDVVLSPDTPDGWTLRGLVLDTINIFEVNRKDCARILLTLSRYVATGTFKPPQNAPAPEEDAQVSTLSPESLIISTMLASLLTLPRSAFKPIYYGSVITELCKLSPNTVAPPVGRAVRKLFSMLGTDGLDVEIVRRIATWFATHLSNFGFQWMWKEWVPELELPASHPKRAFMRRLVELEVRLAYYDRIMDSLPPAMLAEAGAVLAAEAPEPAWLYEKEEHHLYAEAAELHRLLRAKTSPLDIKAHLETLPNAYAGPDEPMSQSIRLMAIETILHLGSRSFSHFLNATERYLDTLRFLTPDPPSRRLLLDGVGNYWRRSSQMRLMTIDKYIQYGIVEGPDVVDWVFQPKEGSGAGEQGDGWTDFEHWEILRMTLDKFVGRVAGVRRRVKNVEREDEAARARKAAEKIERGEGLGEDVDGVDLDDTQERSRELRDAQTSLDIHTTTLERVLLDTTKHFVAELLPWGFDPSSSSHGLAGVLRLLDSGEEGYWGMRARWGWWREFVRLYAGHLRPLAEAVDKHIWDAIESKEEGSVERRAEAMVRSVWAAGVEGV